jgi:hypothetical protein
MPGTQCTPPGRGRLYGPETDQGPGTNDKSPAQDMRRALVVGPWSLVPGPCSKRHAKPGPVVPVPTAHVSHRISE